MKTKQLALVGLTCAVTCILGPLSLSIPVSPVPISLGILGILLAVYLLGAKYGTLSCLVYLLLGLAGLPVFTGFTGGAGKLLGPTGGYMIGYLFLSLTAGFFTDKWGRNLSGAGQRRGIALSGLGMVLGVAVCYLFGTLWLAHQANLSFGAALAAGVLPFIPADLCKILVTLSVGTPIRLRLRRAGLL